VIEIKNVLVATDFSEPSEAALLYGKDFARAYGASLHVVHVADDLAARAGTPFEITPDIGRLQVQLETDARKRLDGLLTTEERNSLRAKTVLRFSTQVADGIIAYARDEKIDLILVGTHGRTGISHFFMGSVAQRVVRLAPCPVLTVRHPEREFVHPDALQVVTRR
jgi:nucleotide-binding universal stress UspA family protein